MLVLVLTGLYTVLGGMRAVAYTEALQTVILDHRLGCCSPSSVSTRSAAGAS